MNWIGRLIQKEVSRSDTVLDLGCGIMQATTNVLIKNKPKTIIRDIARMVKYGRFHHPLASIKILKCRYLLGCDVWDDYLKIAQRFFPVVKVKMDELDRFIDNSFDVCICIDVLEHLEKNQAISSIEHMKRIARKKVIIYTPSKFVTNEEHVKDSWDMGSNPHQAHNCFLEPSLLEELGFKLKFPQPSGNTFGIFDKIISS